MNCEHNKNTIRGSAKMKKSRPDLDNNKKYERVVRKNGQ